MFGDLKILLTCVRGLWPLLFYTIICEIYLGVLIPAPMTLKRAELNHRKRVAARTSLPATSLDSAELAEAAAIRVAADLNAYLLKSDEPSRRLKFVATKTGIHEKTLRRVARKQNRPTYITVFKIYRHLLNEADDAKLLAQVPSEIAAYLQQANPQSFEDGKSYSVDAERELLVNPLASELVILCATGPIKTSFIRKRYGDYGLQVMNMLIERQILSSVSHDQVCTGRVQPNISPETVAAFGIQMSRSYLRPEVAYVTGENFIGFYAEGLTEAAKQKWLAIDKEAFDRKVELAKLPENRGDLRAFTFIATDVVDVKDTK